MAIGNRLIVMIIVFNHHHQARTKAYPTAAICLPYRQLLIPLLACVLATTATAAVRHQP
eukprot:COSAG01_NODE_1317_length_10750_cov_1.790536_16_plen_59_part_00